MRPAAKIASSSFVSASLAAFSANLASSSSSDEYSGRIYAGTKESHAGWFIWRNPSILEEMVESIQ